MLSPLYKIITACHACSLVDTCKGPVPGHGPIASNIMFVGEAPGQKEDESNPRLPFQGAAGQFFDSLLRSIGLTREAVAVTNLVKCRPVGNRTPTPEEAALCADRWLELEIQLYAPKIIVAMGAPAIKYFLGPEATVERTHGFPTDREGVVVFPVYHPAAGMYDSENLRNTQLDFQALGRFLAGEQLERPKDTIKTDYRAALSYSSTEQPVAADTETVDGRLWSLQTSARAGEATFFPMAPGEYPLLEDQTTVHNYLYDAQFLRMPKFQDTMLWAYLLGLPQSLKQLAWQLCGMEMASYDEYVRPWRNELARPYLEKVAAQDWVRVELEETKWHNKERKLATRVKKPTRIRGKIQKLLAADDVDLYAEWYKRYDPKERYEIEQQLGPIPEASLADIPRDQAVYYACRDADATWRVKEVLEPMIAAAGLQYVSWMDHQVLPVLLEMMQTGMGADLEKMQEVSDECLLEMKVYAKEAWAVARAAVPGLEGFNPNSDQQVAKILYDKDHLGFKVTRLTPTGMPAVTAKELKKINHPVVESILGYRQHATVRDTFAGPYLARGATRVHPTIKPTRTATGRLAFADPNLQNIPVRTAIGRKVREGFVANLAEDNVLLSADYSQIEMRVAAHVARCSSLVELFQDGGRDVHTETAAAAWGITLDRVSENQRRAAKTLNFGVMYGLSALGLLDSLTVEGIEGWDKQLCELFIKDYFRIRPELWAWQQQAIAFAARNGYIEDMFGRRRWVPEMMVPVRRIRAEGERQVINMPIQAGAQGIIKLAMGKMWRDGYTAARWILQLHDDLTWEVSRCQVAATAGWARGHMESVVKLDVPVLVDFKVGRRWGSQEKYILGEA